MIRLDRFWFTPSSQSSYLQSIFLVKFQILNFDSIFLLEVQILILDSIFLFKVRCYSFNRSNRDLNHLLFPSSQSSNIDLILLFKVEILNLDWFNPSSQSSLFLFLSLWSGWSACWRVGPHDFEVETERRKTGCCK